MPPELPMIWKVQVATAGMANGTSYPLDVLQRCAPAYDRVAVRYHPRRRDHRIDPDDVSAWVGLLRDPRANAHGIEAELHVFPHRQDVARLLYEGWNHSLGIGIHPLGLSHILLHDGCSIVATVASGEAVWDIRNVFAVDLVARPAMRNAYILGPAERIESMFKTSPSRADIEARHRAEISELYEAEKTLEERRHTLATEIGPVQLASGEAILQNAMKRGDTTIATTALDRNGTLRAELEGTIAAISVARTKRRAAILRFWKAQAETARQQAKTMRQDADALQTKIEALLDQAAELAGSPFMARHVFDQHLLRQGVYIEEPAPLPKPGQLRQDADALEARANQLEKNRVSDQSGTIRGNTKDELIQQVQVDPLELAPALADVWQWLETVTPAALGSNEGQGRELTLAPITPETKYSYTLAWRNGQIDGKQSTVKRRAVAYVKTAA